MPYIAERPKLAVTPSLNFVAHEIRKHNNPEIVVDCTLALLCLVLAPLDNWRYSLIQRVVGVIECAKLEFVGRIAMGYFPRTRSPIHKRAYINNEVTVYMGLQSVVSVALKYRDCIEQDGVLNHCVSRMVAAYWVPPDGWYTRGCEQAIVNCEKSFEDAKQKFYRDVAFPYERKARQTNGDLPEYKNL